MSENWIELIKEKLKNSPKSTYDHQLSSEDESRLDELFTRLNRQQLQFAGYPCNAKFDYSPLYRFLQFTLNNVGDPYEETNYKINIHDFEREVLAFFGDILNLKHGSRGYITSGGTEGNFFGLAQARNNFPDGVLYFSDHTHYSVTKIAKLLQFEYHIVKTEKNGAIDLKDLEAAIVSHGDKPVVMNLNVGTTMTGAIDDILGATQVLQKLDKPYYLHADAALHGMMLPFMDTQTPFDFKSGIHSIAISGHKFIGSPFPCGVVLCREEMVCGIEKIEYVDALDNAIVSSRNGLAPIFMWYAIKRIGKDGFTKEVQYCLNLADYFVATLKAQGVDAWRNHDSSIVVFPRTSDRVIHQWQLAPFEDICHVVVMPHLNEEILDGVASAIINDLN